MNDVWNMAVQGNSLKPNDWLAQSMVQGVAGIPQEKYPSALDVQMGGGHYKQKAIQPVEYIQANNLNFLEGCVVKRITRWRDKGGFEDLQKIKHEIDLLIELERKYGVARDKVSSYQPVGYAPPVPKERNDA